MTLHRSFRTLVVLAALTLLLTACNLVDTVKEAAYDGSRPASVQMLMLSPRVARCDPSETQNLITTLKSQVNPTSGAVDGTSLDSWLTGMQGQFSCIDSLSPSVSAR